MHRTATCRHEDSGDKLVNHACPGARERNGPRAEIVEVFLVVDPEAFKDCGEQIARTDFPVDDLAAIFVGFAVHDTSLDAAAGERGTPGTGEVIASEAGIDIWCA